MSCHGDEGLWGSSRSFRLGDHSLQTSEELLPLRQIAALLIRNEFISLWCALTLLCFLVCLLALLRSALPVYLALRRVRRPLVRSNRESFSREFDSYSALIGCQRALAAL